MAMGGASAGAAWSAMPAPAAATGAPLGLAERRWRSEVRRVGQGRGAGALARGVSITLGDGAVGSCVGCVMLRRRSGSRAPASATKRGC
jgi:hypothetical protein